MKDTLQFFFTNKDRAVQFNTKFMMGLQNILTTMLTILQLLQKLILFLALDSYTTESSRMNDIGADICYVP